MDAKVLVLKRYLLGVFGNQKRMSQTLDLPQKVLSSAFRGNSDDMKTVMDVLERQNRVTWSWLESEAAKERENLQNVIKYQNKLIRALQQAQGIFKPKQD